MLTPAAIAILFVLARSYPSLTRTRAVAARRVSIVAFDRSCVAFFRGLVSGFLDMDMRLQKDERSLT